MSKKPTAPIALEAALLAQLGDIEAKIAELEVEKRAIQRVINKVRSQNIGLKDVTRKNSFSRILIENKIIETISSYESPVSAKILLSAARTVDFDLKETTFRSHLHRMKAKGSIEAARQPGHWKLPTQQSVPTEELSK